MKDIIPAKKQSPILGLSGMGGGVGSNIVAGLAAGPTYVDDVFSTYLYSGNSTTLSVNSGVDNTKGGMARKRVSSLLQRRPQFVRHRKARRIRL